jgi:hypothetical protein
MGLPRGLDIVGRMDMEAVIRQLQDTMVVISAAEQLTAAGLKEHAEWTADQPRRYRKHQQWVANHQRAMAKFDKTLKTLTDFLRRHQE